MTVKLFHDPVQRRGCWRWAALRSAVCIQSFAGTNVVTSKVVARTAQRRDGKNIGNKVAMLHCLQSLK